MDTRNLKIGLANIILIFESLKEAKISRDQLREAIPDGKPEPPFDVPSFIVVSYPNQKAQISIVLPDGRVETRIDLSEADDKTSLELLCGMASNVNGAIENAHLNSYGFNIISNIEITESEQARDFLMQQFKSPLNSLSQQLGGEFISIGVQLNYVKEKRSYQININPEVKGGRKMTVNFNLHFDTNEFPSLNTLKKQYLAFRKEFFQSIGRIFV